MSKKLIARLGMRSYVRSENGSPDESDLGGGGRDQPGEPKKRWRVWLSTHQQPDYGRFFHVFSVVDVCLEDGNAVETGNGETGRICGRIWGSTYIEDTTTLMMMHARPSLTLASSASGIVVWLDIVGLNHEGEEGDRETKEVPRPSRHK